jgi:hypothetical protein
VRQTVGDLASTNAEAFQQALHTLAADRGDRTPRPGVGGDLRRGEALFATLGPGPPRVVRFAIDQP